MCSVLEPYTRHARAINRLATAALLAACTAGKTIADEQSARTAIAEDTAAATD